MNLLELRGVAVHFGGVKALEAVDLCIAPGQIHGLIGPNGAGKTTLLNVICRIVRPSAGELHYQGRDLLPQRPERLAALGIGRTFQNLALMDDATVLDNVMIGLHAHRPGGLVDELLLVARGLRRERAARTAALQALETLGIAQLADAPVQRLSYGQRKMVELARAWVGRPRLLLLDEPTAGLNSNEIERLRETLARIRASEDLTVLVITHHIEFLVGLADAVTVLDLGRSIMAGSPDEVRRDPRVIEAYLGNMA
jgi:ABC-type branched-subunit amino acid transport system ATPase component